MDIFYHSLNYTSKGIIDAACCGAFKRKSAEEAKQLIEDLAKCNYRADSCHSRCIGINKIYILNPTAVAELLQNSGSRVEHRDEFSSYK